MPDVNADPTDTPLLTAFVSAAAAHQVAQTDPGTEQLVAQLALLAAKTLALRDALESKRNQEDILRQAYVHARGLATVAAVHFVYNKMNGRGDYASAEALSTAANALLNTLCQSPVYTRTEGDLCQVDARKLNQSLSAEISGLLGDIPGILQSKEMKDAYVAWACPLTDGTPAGGALLRLGGEARIAHQIIADAVEVLTKADPENPFAMSASDIVERTIDEIRTDPDSPDSADSVLELALPTWKRLYTALGANAAGSLAPTLGPDALLLKLALLRCSKAIPKMLVDPSKAAALRALVIPKIADALAMDATEMNEKVDKLLTKDKRAVVGKIKVSDALASSGSPGGASQDEVDSLKAHEAVGTAEAEAAGKRFTAQLRKEIEEIHVHDGAIINSVLAGFAILQFVDALWTFRETKDGWSTAKTVSDMAGAAVVIGSTVPAIPLRLWSGKWAWFDKSARGFSGKAVPLLGMLSGGLQVAEGLTSGSRSDLAIGGLNVLSGTMMLASLGTESVFELVIPFFALPVVGQSAAILAFGIGAAVAIEDALMTMTERYVSTTVDTLKKAPWDHEPKGTLADALGISAALDAVAAAASTTYFQTIPCVPGVPRETLLTSITFFAGKEAAEEIVDQATDIVYGPPSPS